MFRRILIPLDTSEVAERVLDYLPPLANKDVTNEDGTELVLVSVIAPESYAYATAADEPELLVRFKEKMEQRYSQYLQEAKQRLTAQGYQVRVVLLYGEGAQAIVDVATRESCDLIAMTTHGRTGFRRWIMGSVADRVLQTASQPVFLARAEPALSAPYVIANVLLPLDGSSLAEQALPLAQGVAAQTQAKVTILHVLTHLTSWEKQALGETPLNADSFEADRAAKAQTYLEGLCNQLKEAQVDCAAEIATGNAANLVLERAKADEIDLIVMNSHGRSGYFRWTQGSVASKVLQGTNCPIMLTRSLQMVDVGEE